MKVAQVIFSFALGGTEKAGCVLAERLAAMGHQAWVIGLADGPRRLREPQTNLSHILLEKPSIASFLECLKSIRPDILHVHNYAYAEGMIRAIKSDPDLQGITIVSTPVFGRPPKDPSILDQTATCTIGVYVYYRLLRWLGMTGERALARGIGFVRLNISVPPPVPLSSLDPPDVLTARRSALGIPIDHMIIGRLGRKDPSKWNQSSEMIVNTLLERLPQAAWASIGFPVELGAERLAARWGRRFVNFDETSDYRRLCEILSSLDVQAFFSRFGECFAFSICEAAAVAVPSIALCTPSRDNGQSEQIIEGISGHLVASAADAASVLANLSLDPEKLARLKQTTFDLNDRRSSADAIMPRLVDFYQYCLSGYRAPLQFGAELLEDHRDFAGGYRDRVARTMSHNVLGQTRWMLQLAAQENYSIFKVGRFFKRLVSAPAPDPGQFM